MAAQLNVTLSNMVLPMQALRYIEQEDETKCKLKVGFVPNMRVPGYFYVNDRLKGLVFEELQHACGRQGHGGFLPAIQQLANVAGLPGIVKVIPCYTRNYQQIQMFWKC